MSEISKLPDDMMLESFSKLTFDLRGEALILPLICAAHARNAKQYHDVIDQIETQIETSTLTVLDALEKTSKEAAYRSNLETFRRVVQKRVMFKDMLPIIDYLENLMFDASVEDNIAKTAEVPIKSLACDVLLVLKTRTEQPTQRTSVGGYHEMTAKLSSIHSLRSLGGCKMTVDYKTGKHCPCEEYQGNKRECCKGCGHGAISHT